MSKPTMDELLEAVAEMRRWQRQFFGNPQGSPARIEALTEAQKIEKRVDAMLAALSDPQEDMGL